MVFNGISTLLGFLMPINCFVFGVFYREKIGKEVNWNKTTRNNKKGIGEQIKKKSVKKTIKK